MERLNAKSAAIAVPAIAFLSLFFQETENQACARAAGRRKRKGPGAILFDLETFPCGQRLGSQAAVGPGVFQGLSSKFSRAKGSVTLDLRDGNLAVEVYGLPGGKSFDVWLIDNRPGPKALWSHGYGRRSYPCLSMHLRCILINGQWPAFENYIAMLGERFTLAPKPVPAEPYAAAA